MNTVHTFRCQVLYITPCRGEELKYQGVVRDEMTQLETALLTTQRDYELLKVLIIIINHFYYNFIGRLRAYHSVQ